MQVHTRGISLCPLSLPLPPSLLANFYSSFRAQLQCHPLSNANTSNRGQKYNSSLMLPTVLPAHSFQRSFFLVLAELSSPPQVPVLPLGTVQNHFQHPLQIMTSGPHSPHLSACPAQAAASLGSLLLSGSLLPITPTTAESKERLSKLIGHSTILCTQSHQPPLTTTIPNSGPTHASATL